MTTHEILRNARPASAILALKSESEKNEALKKMAAALISDKDTILAANLLDVNKAKGSVSDVMLDRLKLTDERLNGMAKGILDLTVLPDPVGRVLSEEIRPNGLKISKISVPFGVLAIIYESRPNVTSDAAALSLKSGNACVLRSGKEAHESAKAIVSALQNGLADAGFPRDCVQLVEDTSRESANELMTANGLVDLLIPRGGKGLIRACVENATVPCIETGTGICHIFIDESADLQKALSIVENAKKSRPSVCNAAEVCLVHEKIAAKFIPALEKILSSGEHPVKIHADDFCMKYLKNGILADENSFDTEFLDYEMALAAVPDARAAIAHINAHSTRHSEAIVTENRENAALFCKMIDSAALYVNASTRFTDGGEFGLGCEMGISTQKMHARGPMGLSELNTYKYIIEGNGQIR